MDDYKIKPLFEGAILTYHLQYGRQLWERVRLRVHRNSKCAICGTKVGTYGYRPLTNGYNRMQRICCVCAEGEK